MSLLNPTWAEMADRLTILQRKLLQAEETGRSVEPFRDEISELKGAMNITLKEETILNLATINAAIWDALDRHNPEKAQSLNMRRAILRGETKL